MGSDESRLSGNFIGGGTCDPDLRGEGRAAPGSGDALGLAGAAGPGAGDALGLAGAGDALARDARGLMWGLAPQAAREGDNIRGMSGRRGWGRGLLVGLEEPRGTPVGLRALLELQRLVALSSAPEDRWGLSAMAAALGKPVRLERLYAKPERVEELRGMPVGLEELRGLGGRSAAAGLGASLHNVFPLLTEGASRAGGAPEKAVHVHGQTYTQASSGGRWAAHRRTLESFRTGGNCKAVRGYCGVGETCGSRPAPTKMAHFNPGSW